MRDGYLVMAHRGWYSTQSRRTDRPNTRVTCQISGHRDDIDIIELDIRKSRDGILYCYHGNAFFYLTSLLFQRRFVLLRRRYQVDTLAEILDVISSGKMLFLDLKTHTITREDILEAFAGRTFREVLLANKSVRFLDRFRDMPSGFVKIMNGNLFCGWYDYTRLKAKNYKYIELLLPFQVRRSLVNKIERQGLIVRCCVMFFFRRRYYVQRITAAGIQHISTDFI